MAIAVAACCVFLAGLSVLQRIRSRGKMRKKRIPDEIEHSPISDALRELVALAGGIYLGLLMLTSFLQIEVPDRIGWSGFTVEPLAALAFILAVIQPFIGNLIGANRRYL